MGYLRNPSVSPSRVFGRNGGSVPALHDRTDRNPLLVQLCAVCGTEVVNIQTIIIPMLKHCMMPRDRAMRLHDVVGWQSADNPRAFPPRWHVQSFNNRSVLTIKKGGGEEKEKEKRKNLKLNHRKLRDWAGWTRIIR